MQNRDGSRRNRHAGKRAEEGRRTKKLRAQSKELEREEADSEVGGVSSDRGEIGPANRSQEGSEMENSREERMSSREEGETEEGAQSKGMDVRSDMEAV